MIDHRVLTTAAMTAINKANGTPEQGPLVGLSLDIAILYGALQARRGHPELATLPEESIEALLKEKLDRLLAVC